MYDCRHQAVVYSILNPQRRSCMGTAVVQSNYLSIMIINHQYVWIQAQSLDAYRWASLLNTFMEVYDIKRKCIEYRTQKYIRKSSLCAPLSYSKVSCLAPLAWTTHLICPRRRKWVPDWKQYNISKAENNTTASILKCFSKAHIEWKHEKMHLSSNSTLTNLFDY